MTLPVQNPLKGSRDVRNVGSSRPTPLVSAGNLYASGHEAPARPGTAYRRFCSPLLVVPFDRQERNTDRYAPDTASLGGLGDRTRRVRLIALRHGSVARVLWPGDDRP
jgi:hypothetical protein